MQKYQASQPHNDNYLVAATHLYTGDRRGGRSGHGRRSHCRRSGHSPVRWPARSSRSRRPCRSPARPSGRGCRSPPGTVDSSPAHGSGTGWRRGGRDPSLL